MLSLEGWLCGLTGSGVLLVGISIGLFLIYKSKKLNANLLFLVGLKIIFMSLLFLGQFVDFLSILFFGTNLNPAYLYGLLCYMWVAPTVVFGLYISATLIIPEKRKIIVGIYTIIGIIFEFFLWFDFNNSFTIKLPDQPGTRIIDINFNRTHPTFILIAFFLITALLFLGVGFAIKAKQAAGELRKNFALLSAGWIMFVICGMLDSLTDPGIGLFIVRIGYQSSSWFFYFALKEKQLQLKEFPSTRDQIIDDSKASLIVTLSRSRPLQISEEEVTFYKEKTICLVCKGKVEGFNFICKNCKALYCAKCANALSNLDNACWVCDSPIDPSKPSIKYNKKKSELDNEPSMSIEKEELKKK